MTIRTKEKVQFVRYHNNGSKLNHVLHRQAALSAKNKNKKESSAESSAATDVQSTVTSTASEMAYRIKRHVDKQSEKRYYAKQERINNSRNRKTTKTSKTEPVKSSPTTTSNNNNKIATLNARNNTISKTKQQSANTAKDTFTYVVNKAETMIVSAFNAVKTGLATSSNTLIMGIAAVSVVMVIVITSFFGTGGAEAMDQPNFYNLDAYVIKNPYAQSGLYGQCTWFAWGRFYELYGYSPGFTGDGWNCAEQLVAAHPDTWELSDTPTDRCVFSGVGVNHVGIVLYYQNGILTIQHGNMDGETNTFEDATKDWCEMQISLDEIRDRYDGVVFAVPK